MICSPLRALTHLCGMEQGCSNWRVEMICSPLRALTLIEPRIILDFCGFEEMIYGLLRALD